MPDNPTIAVRKYIEKMSKGKKLKTNDSLSSIEANREEKALHREEKRIWREIAKIDGLIVLSLPSSEVEKFFRSIIDIIMSNKSVNLRETTHTIRRDVFPFTNPLFFLLEDGTSFMFYYFRILLKRLDNFLKAKVVLFLCFLRKWRCSLSRADRRRPLLAKQFIF
jgi:hypothetical protein